MSTTTNTAAPAGEPAKARWQDALRDNGLATVAMVLVVGVAMSGWSASFIALHEFAMKHIFLAKDPAWLVPATFDGAALSLSLLSFRAAIYGRSSFGSLFYVYGFTALSSWINWIHIQDPQGRFVSALLPIAAVLAFGKVLKEAREAYERRNGKQVFKVRAGLLVLRWFVDRRGTRTAIKDQILDIPVQALIGLGAGNLAREAAEQLADEKAGAETETAKAEEPQQTDPVVAALLRTMFAQAGLKPRTEQPGTPEAEEEERKAAAIVAELLGPVLARVGQVPQVHTSAAEQDGSEAPAVNQGVNPEPVGPVAERPVLGAEGFTPVLLPHQLNRSEDLGAGSLEGSATDVVDQAQEAAAVNLPVNLGEGEAEQSETAEVHTSDGDKGVRMDSKTSQSVILAGWFSGESASSIAKRTGRTQRWVYQQFNLLDAEHGQRPRKDDTAEIPAITTANGFAVDH